ncbi:hypothetical protein [Kitasatospora sp. NPDC086791]|uniref:hypothetical protein n=1 Tax=Kitasatospora sp. NPDC086791 TaxID=3155178 RepID=UPI003416D3A8
MSGAFGAEELQGSQEPQGSQKRPGAGRPGRTRTGLGIAARWVRGRSARWVVVGAAAVALGGGVAAVAVHHEHEGHGDGRTSAAGDREQYDAKSRHDGRQRHEGPQQRDSRDGHRGHGVRADGEDGGPNGQGAPAPLPSTEAADAVAKASSAVAGGRVESLATVAEQGGGRAWRAVVVGPDGVRHAVTVDGATGTVTGNTVVGGSSVHTG